MSEEKLSTADERKKMIEEQKEALAAEQAQEEQRVAKEAKEKELAEQKLRDEEAAKEKKAKQSKAALKLQQALEMKYQNLQSYADDSSKYQPRLTDEQRHEYWLAAQKNKMDKMPPTDFPSYIKFVASQAPSNEIHGNFMFIYIYGFSTGSVAEFFPLLSYVYHTKLHYYYLYRFCLMSLHVWLLHCPPTYLDYALPRRILLNFMVHRIWDYLYLTWLLIWLICVMIVKDRLAFKFNLPVGAFASAPAGTEHLPLLFMFLSQLPPAIGAFYFTHFCNDLTKCVARSNLNVWACNAVLISQYIEFTFYGGKNRADKAGKCRFNKEGGWLFRQINKLFAAKVNPEEDYYNFDDPDQPQVIFPDDGEDMYEEQWDDASINTQEQLMERGETKLGDGGDGNQGGNAVDDVDEAAEYMAKVEAVKERALEDAKLAAIEERKKEERKCKEWHEWRCITCGKANRRPAKPAPEINVSFMEKGTFYKRTVATVTKLPNEPKCEHCLTNCSYKIPIATRHLFPHNPKPHVAFETYPKHVVVQGGVKPGKFKRLLNITYSFFFGITDNATSRLAYNDWRLRLYMNDQFAEIPRQFITPPKHVAAAGIKSEPLELGEIAECKLQKSEWSRCRIINVRKEQMYDIKYDTGEELRFVKEHLLRLKVEKRDYAYRVELCIAFLIFHAPVALAANFIISPAVLCLGMFFISSQLVLALLLQFINNMHSFYQAGCCLVFGHIGLFLIPAFLFWLSSAMGVIAIGVGIPWKTVGIMWCITKMSCLHCLYIIRPTWGTMGLWLFILTSAFGIMVGAFADGNPMTSTGYDGAIAFLPGIGACLTLFVYRNWLGYIWDVSLRIRPLMRLNMDSRSGFQLLLDGIYDWMCKPKPKLEPEFVT